MYHRSGKLKVLKTMRQKLGDKGLWSCMGGKYRCGHVDCDVCGGKVTIKGKLTRPTHTGRSRVLAHMNRWNKRLLERRKKEEKEEEKTTSIEQKYNVVGVNLSVKHYFGLSDRVSVVIQPKLVLDCFPSYRTHAASGQKISDFLSGKSTSLQQRLIHSLCPCCETPVRSLRDVMGLYGLDQVSGIIAEYIREDRKINTDIYRHNAPGRIDYQCESIGASDDDIAVGIVVFCAHRAMKFSVIQHGGSKSKVEQYTKNKNIMRKTPARCCWMCIDCYRRKEASFTMGCIKRRDFMDFYITCKHGSCDEPLIL
jgi:hypothetical protein